jgi:peptidyl-prolyl cis-trans isomerase D
VEELNGIQAQLDAGESFGAIAQEVSEDPGSANQAGDLGFAGRGVFDPAFEEALFALEAPGDVSNPVKTEFGYHLIQLEEIRDHEYPTFEQARADVEQRLRREQAGGVYEERLRELDNLAFEQPNGLEGIEEALGLAPQTAVGVTREQGPPPFDDPQVRERLFTSDVLDKRFNSAAVEFGDSRAIVMRVSERHEPKLIAFDDVADEIRNGVETERARALAEQAFEEARSRLESGASAAEVAQGYDANWQTFEQVRRNAAEIPRGILQQAFALPRPPEGGKSVGQATLPAGGTALITVTRVQDGQVEALTEAELNSMRGFLADRVSRLEFSALYETVREAASIKRVE